jgi:hypothetical protein
MPKIFQIAILLLLIPVLVFSQDLNRNIKWEKPEKLIISEGRSIEILFFENAVFKDDAGFLPYYFERFKLDSKNTKVIFELNNIVFDELTETDILKDEDVGKISDEIIINSDVSIDRGTHFACLSFLPIRKNPVSGKFEKVISYEIQKKLIHFQNSKNPQKSRIYAEHSVLSSGNWYKIRAKNYGIHKISYNDLISMGVDVASINPNDLRIYGNGTGMLHEANSGFRIDDLLENTIKVIGEEDGSFDEDDYILFYAESQVKWNYNEIQKRFEHSKNIYSDYTYYFITADLGSGKRIQTTESTIAEPTDYVTTFSDYTYHEEDIENVIKSGKDWLGERFENQLTYEFPFNFPNICTDVEVLVKMYMVARSMDHSYFKFFLNEEEKYEMKITSIANSDNTYARFSEKKFSYFPEDTLNVITVSYDHPNSSSIGWMDYMYINLRRHLKFCGNQLSFRDINSFGDGNIAQFKLSNASELVNIWDVSRINSVIEINADLINDSLIFTLPTDSLRQFIAFDGSSYYSPEFVEKVENQDLHATTNADYIIISHPDFLNEAKWIGDFHLEKDGLSYVVATPDRIYNEFSSGAQDISAIRDFVKMIYDKAPEDQKPKYLLLFGDGSYDYKDRIEIFSNFVPTFQSSESLRMVQSYVCDDFFGLLDDNEGQNADGTLDIGVGRLPVNSVDEANNVINKIQIYASESQAVMGDWRNRICFIADDEGKNAYINHAEELDNIIQAEQDVLNVNKIYLDAFQQIKGIYGERYPEVNKAINEQVEEGAFIIDYIGHGSEVGWSDEHVLEISDIINWKNINKLPMFMTATCEFSRYDNPGMKSAGEIMFLSPNGGAIALITTTRLAFSTYNQYVNKRFISNVYKKTDGEHYTIGDIYRLSKTPQSTHTRNITLFGDPALTLAYPKYGISTTLINNIPVSEFNDTLKAFTKVTINGIIENNGQKIEDFNGQIFPIVYDKPTVNKTLGNDSQSYPKEFLLRDKILYKGNCIVTNGEFSFTFVVPDYLTPQYGFGLISYYAHNDYIDVTGSEQTIMMGGVDHSAPVDVSGPEISIYLEKYDFVSGDITSNSPIMYVSVFDENGIYLSGNGFGRDIVAVLDDDYRQQIILNEYFNPDPDSYQSGKIVYPFTNLSNGKHKINFKAWDVCGNSSEVKIEFFVDENARLILSRVTNMPNPFKNSTEFIFDHNKSFNDYDVCIKIFSIRGQLVKTINKNIKSANFVIEPIQWNGRNDNGEKLNKGIYIYRILVQKNDFKAEQTQKLILM